MFLRIAGFRCQRLIIRLCRDERTKVIFHTLYSRDTLGENFNFETRQLIIFGFREGQEICDFNCSISIDSGTFDNNLNI